MADSQRNFIDVSSIREELACPVCCDIFVDAVAATCGHTFCSACISEWLNLKHECPICNSTQTISDLVPVVTIRNICSKLLPSGGLLRREHSISDDTPAAPGTRAATELLSTKLNAVSSSFEEYFMRLAERRDTAMASLEVRLQSLLAYSQPQRLQDGEAEERRTTIAAEHGKHLKNNLSGAVHLHADC